MYELSKGTLHQIMNGRNIKRPVFQLLNYKRLPNLISDWYMLNVSDGLKMNEYTLLSIELNNLFKNGALTKYTIFKVTNYKLESTNDERQTLIITGCEVLFPGNQVRRIIGNPTIIEFESETYKFHSPTAVHQEVGNTMQSSTSRDTNISSCEESTVPIVTLNPDYNRQTIQGRVFNKSPILRWRKEKGQLFFIQMHIKSSEIKCVAFNDECDKFYDKIEDGKVYCISNYKLQNTMPRYKMFKSKYDIMMTKDTQIKECHDDGSIPLMHFDFCPISQVENKKKHDRIDVLGVVVKSSNIIQRRKKLLRNVDIVDNSRQGGAKICITLDQRAEEFDCFNGTILAIKEARVDEFNGKILVIMTSSVIKINPDLPEAHELRTWYDGNNYLDNGIHFNIPTLTFKQVTEKRLQPSTSFTYNMIAKIDSINSENSICMDCPESKCAKKLFKLFANKFRCDKCNIEHPNFKYYLQLEMNISDATGSHSLTAFNEVAAEIVGMPLQELINLKVNDNNAYVQKINDTISKEYLFRLKREKKAFQGQLIETCICESVQPLLSHDTNQDVFAEQN